MIAIKALRFLHLLVYLVLVSQLAYYLFVMGDAMKMVGIGNFIEQRKIVDPLVHQRHVPFYYAGLVLSMVLLALLWKQWNSLTFLTMAIAFALLVADVSLSQIFNKPINELINKKSIGEQGVDWDLVRAKWIYYIKVRAILTATGFVALLYGAMFSKK